MPVHYGSRAANVQTISSPLGTKIPQAAGAAYQQKLEGKKACTICYFGDGAASEGDFHAGLNFAATLKCPVIFFCRNNGYAISTPVKSQYFGDGIVPRGLAYGMHSIRVDGNDLLAVYQATKEARRIAIEEGSPSLIEAMTYRVGHHSTSDDSTRYRGKPEIDQWTKEHSPIARCRAYLEKKGWWSAAQHSEYVDYARQTVDEGLTAALAKKKPSLSSLFEDVFDVIPKQLLEQQAQLHEHLAKYPADYDLTGFK
jgi:2-oxoisovalerate dehydrogenase E1 component alpha subunit